MFSPKKALTVLVALVLSISITSAAQGVVDEQFVGSPPSDVRRIPYYGFYANGLGAFPANFNFLVGFKADGSVMNESKVTGVGACQSLADENCKGAQLIRYRAIIGLCENKDSTDCIQDIRVTKDQGEQIAFSREEVFPPSNSDHFTGDSKIGLPSGRSAPIISIPTLAHSGGNKYLVLVTYESFRLPNSTFFEPPQIKAAIYGTKLNSTPISGPGIQTNLRFYDKLSLSMDGWSNPSTSCPIYGLFGCAERYELPIGVNFGLTLKLSRPVKGWLHGRINDVDSKITIDSAGSQVISIDGKPLVLPTVYSWVKKENAPDSIARYYETLPKPLGGNGYGCLDALDAQDCGARPANLWVSVMRDALPDTPSMQEFLAWLPHLGDKATSAPTIWRVESMQNSGESDACYSSAQSLSGFVSTNATQYISGPPVFNRNDQALDYKVAAPHYLPNGKEFLGSYDLIISSSVARCLYGFSEAPISASVSVTSADGKEKVATTVLGEKDGWLSLSAKGFTFSSPTIRVKLEQKTEKAPVVEPSPQPTAIPESQQTQAQPKPAFKQSKKSITCIKGKNVKKVSGTNPKCPVGFKKK